MNTTTTAESREFWFGLLRDIAWLLTMILFVFAFAYMATGFAGGV